MTTSIVTSSICRCAAGAIKQGQTVTVSYTAPTDGSEVIEDVDGNDALSFTDFEVVNKSTVDGTPPVLASAEAPVSGDRLSLIFDEALDIGPAMTPSGVCLHRQDRRRPGDGPVRDGRERKQ